MNGIKMAIARKLKELASVEYHQNEWSKENIARTWFFPTEIFSDWIQDIPLDSLKVFLEYGSITREVFDDLLKLQPPYSKFVLMLEKGEINKREYECLHSVDISMRYLADEYYRNGTDVDLRKFHDYEPWKKLVESAQEAIRNLEGLGWKFEPIPENNWSGKKSSN